MDVELAKLIITGVVSPTIALVAKYIYDKKTSEDLKNQKENMEISLTEHPFFERMKFLRTHIQYSFELQNKGKQEVFKDILVNKFNIAIEEYWQMVNEIEKEKDTLTEPELCNIITDHLRTTLKIHETYYRNTMYTPDEQKCLEIVMQKFNKWNSPRIESVCQTIQNVCTSRFYSGVVTKTSVALDVLQGAFVDTINDAELTLNGLNGDLKGLIFKGIKL